jgi:hypothetical protein
MKRFIMIIGAISLTAMVVSAVDAYSVRDVRDPRKLATRLTDDFTSVVSTSDSARVSVLEATAVTNATLTQSKAAVTATAVVTPQTKTIEYMSADGSTNTLAVCTNATVAVTVVNGGTVCTNVAVTLTRQ